MAGDWSLPVNATPYANVLDDISARLVDAFTLASLSAPSNTPTGAKKYDEGNDKFQRWNGAAWVDLLLSIAGGGTGASTASGARTNLGLGDMAVQNASAVAITGGSISGVSAPASIITSGLIAQARLGTGSGGTGAKFLADDQTYKTTGGSVVGEGKLWFTNTPPADHLICDGSSLLRATFAALFAVLGTTWGAVDGTHFSLPDLRQRFPLGKAASGTGNTLTGTGGAIDHTHSYTDVVNHTHSVNITDPGHVHTATPTAAGWDVTSGDSLLSGGVAGQPVGLGVSIASATTGISATTANPGGGVASGTTAGSNPPYVVVNYIIRYQ